MGCFSTCHKKEATLGTSSARGASSQGAGSRFRLQTDLAQPLCLARRCLGQMCSGIAGELFRIRLWGCLFQIIIIIIKEIALQASAFLDMKQNLLVCVCVWAGWAGMKALIKRVRGEEGTSKPAPLPPRSRSPKSRELGAPGSAAGRQ